MRKIGISTLLILAILFGVVVFSDGQEDQWLQKMLPSVQLPDTLPPVEFIAGTQASKVAAAKEQFKKIQGVPDFYAESIYLALWHFPELKDVQIEVVYKHIATTMQVRPRLGAVFRSAGKRSYRLFINNKADFEGILFGEIPFNAKVGIVSHELCHILDYQHKNTFQLIGTGLRFMSKKGKRKYERSIDRLTVYKGMGWQLRDWAQYAIYDSDATLDYKAFKKTNYLDTQEVETLIQESGRYEEH